MLVSLFLTANYIQEREQTTKTVERARDYKGAERHPHTGT